MEWMHRPPEILLTHNSVKRNVGESSVNDEMLCPRAE